MDSDMNWDTDLRSVLSEADGSVAKMRERLTPAGRFSKGEDVFPVRELRLDSRLDRPAPLHVPLDQKSRLSPGPGVQWVDVAALQSQLQMQSQAIDSLTKKMCVMERERQSQQCYIQTLQGDIDSLRDVLRQSERERGESPGAERMMEKWRREVAHELKSLRGHVSAAMSLGDREESFSAKLRQEELEHLRREVDQLKTCLRRQEEDTFLRQAEARESRRWHERRCEKLEELTESYRSHCSQMAKTVSLYSNVQQEVQQIRLDVSALKDDVKSVILREGDPAPSLAANMPDLPPSSVLHDRRRAVGPTEPDSESEDFSPTPSLAEVSSDNLSWLEENDAGRHHEPHVRRSARSRRSDVSGPGTDWDEGDGSEDDEDSDEGHLVGDDDDDDSNPDLGSELNLTDL